MNSQLKPGGSGDITPSVDASSSDFIAWKINRSGIQMASPVLREGHLYLLERRSGVVHCIDAGTGTTASRARIPAARAFWASLWTCNNQIFCLDDSGTTFVLASGSNLRVLRKNVINEQAWSTPAIASGELFLRTIDHLYCIATNSD